MPAQIISGKDIAEQIREELKPRIDKLKEKGIVPGLAAIIVGEDPAAMSYIRGIAKGGEKVGMITETVSLPTDITQPELEKKVVELNENSKFHGIILQRPLPEHISDSAIVNLLSPDKDVDCLSPINISKLITKEEGGFAPCTPSAVIEILDRLNIEIDGKRAVIVGGAGKQGKTIGIMLLNRWATVYLCDYKTVNPAEEYQRAEILVSAMGLAKKVKTDWVPQGAIVIDVGVSTDENGKLSGDVDFEPVKEIAGMITPVPGGVGSVTTAMLLSHTVTAAEELTK